MWQRLPFIGTAFIFLFVQFAALALAPLLPMEYQAFENAQDPVNPLIYILMILIVTGVVLLLIRLGKNRLIQALFMFSVLVTIVFISLPLVFMIWENVEAALVISVCVGVVMVVALLLRPEWYVIDIVGIVLATGVAAILGISLGILPTLILLLVLAVYDAISVYKTKHMIALAEGVAPLGLPVLFVMPRRREFSMKSLKGKRITEQGEEREAVFMGLGDSVIPGILAVSSFMFLPSFSNYTQYADLLVSIGVILGSFLGYLALMTLVVKGRPQAGLPLLNGGAILGFVISYLFVFRDLGFGIL
jgi:presenilin-like A22 family membrane protease